VEHDKYTNGTYRLGRALDSEGLPRLLQLCDAIAKDPAEQIICDAASLKFVDPVGLCVLAATCCRLARYGRRLQLLNVPSDIASYLARMDLFKVCGIEYLEQFTRHNRKSELLEIRVVDKGGDGEGVAKSLTMALLGATPSADRPVLDEEMFASPDEHLEVLLHHVFSELLENALTHGRRAGYGCARAWAAAQYYPARDRIRAAVVDDGCGFLKTLHAHPLLVEKTDAAAAVLALEPRITCNPDLDVLPGHTRNQGIGLTIVRDIADLSGVLRVASGDALIKRADGNQISRAVPSWSGVILALDFDRRRLQNITLNQVVRRLRKGDDPHLRFT